MTRLYHYTCHHGRRKLKYGGLLVPGIELLANRPTGTTLATVSLEVSRFVWLTDLSVPIRDALGLTKHHIRCDRTQFRYRVTQPGAAMRWTHVRRTLPPALVDLLENTPGARPAHWWVTHDAVPCEYDPIPEPAHH